MTLNLKKLAIIEILLNSLILVMCNKFYLIFFKKKFIYLTFLRKNKIFLKNKYSKVRLYNKTIVLFSLLLNIIFINELHNLYYNITLNFGFFVYLLYIYLFLFCLKIHLTTKK